MGFGYHLVAYNIEHCAACKSQRKGEDCGRYTNGEVADECAHNLDKSCSGGYEESALWTDSRKQHGTYDNHTLGDVLQCNAARNYQCVGGISRAEADACGNTLGQIVDCNSGDKKQGAVKVCFLVRFDVRACKSVQMGYHLINNVKTIAIGASSSSDGNNALANVFLNWNDEKLVSSSSDSKYEKIGDYKLKDYVERPHEYQK